MVGEISGSVYVTAQRHLNVDEGDAFDCACCYKLGDEFGVSGGELNLGEGQFLGCLGEGGGNLVADARRDWLVDESSAIVAHFILNLGTIKRRGKDYVAEHADIEVIEAAGSDGIADSTEALTPWHIGRGEVAGKLQGLPVIDIDGPGMDKMIAGEVCTGAEFEDDLTGLRLFRCFDWGFKLSDELESHDTLFGLASPGHGKINRSGSDWCSGECTIKGSGIESVVDVAGPEGCGEDGSVKLLEHFELFTTLVRVQVEWIADGAVDDGGRDEESCGECRKS